MSEIRQRIIDNGRIPLMSKDEIRSIVHYVVNYYKTPTQSPNELARYCGNASRLSSLSDDKNPKGTPVSSLINVGNELSYNLTIYTWKK